MANTEITQLITRIAEEEGVDPKLALAVAQQESGLNPDAIGDNGHSVGLFQLNDQGEGAGMSVAARQDPETNARIAIQQIANVQRSQPGLSPGQLAAAAQRPADRAGYAQSIDNAMGTSLSPEQYADQSTSGSQYRNDVQNNVGGPTLNEQDLASEYGFAASFFGSDPELQNLISQAVKEQWTPQQFQARFQGTQWYQTHAQSVRDFIALQTSDPATYQSRLTQQEADLRNQAAAMGATLSDADLTKLATNSLEFGWDSTQTTQALATHVSASGAGGNAADTLTSLKSYVQSMGVNIPDQTLNNYVQQIEAGTSSTGTFQQYVRKLASSAFPAYAQQINAGTTVADIASPYTSDMASILELNPQSITLQDPTIRKMLTGTDPATGQPAQTGLWDFEKSLRADPRWQYTQNATDTVYSTLSTIGKSWGLST